ncbi:MAG: hypothetical protein ABEI53_01875 [Candidatus Magasanikbacteria bacterium]
MENFEKINKKRNSSDQIEEESFKNKKSDPETLREIDRLNENPKLIEKKMDNGELADFIEKVKSTPEFKKYKKQKVRLETFSKMKEKLIDRLKQVDKKDEYQEEIIKFFKDRVKSLKSTIEDYRRNIVNMERLRGSAIGFHMSNREKKQRLKKVDRERRNNHNLIQDYLRQINRLPNKINEELDIDIEWSRFFSSSQIENRNSVRDWAYNTAVVQRMKELLKKAKEKKAEH